MLSIPTFLLQATDIPRREKERKRGQKSIWWNYSCKFPRAEEKSGIPHIESTENPIQDECKETHNKTCHNENGKLLGAIMGGPARDEVMKKIPGRQGRPGPHPWQGHEEITWQATPSRIRDPPGWPWPLPYPISSPLFLLLFLFALLWILVLSAESSPAPVSLNKDQLKS